MTSLQPIWVPMTRDPGALHHRTSTRSRSKGTNTPQTADGHYDPVVEQRIRTISAGKSEWRRVGVFLSSIRLLGVIYIFAPPPRFHLHLPGIGTRTPFSHLSSDTRGKANPSPLAPRNRSPSTLSLLQAHPVGYALGGLPAKRSRLLKKGDNTHTHKQRGNKSIFRQSEFQWFPDSSQVQPVKS